MTICLVIGYKHDDVGTHTMGLMSVCWKEVCIADTRSYRKPFCKSKIEDLSGQDENQ